MPEQDRWNRAINRVAALLILSFSFLGICPGSQAQCDSVKSGERIWVRLLEPLASYSAMTGVKIEAMVIESPRCDGEEMIPAGSVVAGEVTAVRKVGMGFLHETARMHAEFRSLRLKDGTEIAITSRLLEIDNARERVKDGTIRGVNATDTPQGRIPNRLRHLPSLNPYSNLTWVAYRSVFPFFPEPEIYLPRGSDLKLELTSEGLMPERWNSAAVRHGPAEI